MAWKVNPQDLLPTQFGAKGQFGSRFSLGRLSLPVMKKDVVFRHCLVSVYLQNFSLIPIITFKKDPRMFHHKVKE